jgi:DNA-directed RNA polymerase specialized sigma24 family protein
MDNKKLMQENQNRLDILYRKHHKWLIGTAFNFCKNEQIAEDLVGDLYVYLGEKVREKVWAKESFNILYCITFLQSRWLNKVNRDKKIQYRESIKDEIVDSVYDEEWDNKLEKAYEEVINNIKNTHKTGMFVSSKLMEMYWLDFPDETLAGIAKKVNISNSTVYIHIKKMKQKLKQEVRNPFE